MSGALQQIVLHFQQQHFQDALRLIKGLPRNIGQQGQVLHIRAVCHAQLQQLDEADKYYRKAIEAKPNSPEILVQYTDLKRTLGLLDEGLVIADSAVRRFPNDPEVWFSRALTWDIAGNAEKAISDYKKVVELRHNHAIAWSNLGQVLRKTGELEEAKKALDQSLVLRPRHPQTLAKRANVLHDMGMLEEALADQAEALRSLPNDPAVLAGYARSCQRLGQTERALVAYQEAIRLMPSDLLLHSDFNRLLWESGYKEQFLVSLDYALGKTDETRQGSLLGLKGELARLREDDDVAEEAFRQALPIASTEDRATILAGLAGVAQRRNDVETADALYREALEVQPDATKFLHSYAGFLMEQQAFQEALILLDKDVADDDLQRHLALKALACRATGDERYRYWYDYDRLTASRVITPPPKYGSLANFLEAVQVALEPAFSTQQAPLDQTLFHGLQTPGNLWDIRNPVLQELKACLLECVATFLAGVEVENDEEHPFLRRMLGKSDFSSHLKYTGAWAVKLTNQGGHIDHIHPDGWMSASHYVTVPEQMSPDEGSKAGWLRLGASGVKGLQLGPERYIKPEPGHIIMFPSYIWHGVEPIQTEEPRITTPFDVSVG